uniref:glycerol kinase n=1 Tax=Corethron hystrix TaxID=216773 RepID=A0A7S1G0F9_9STRA|mmetsp:Transcript_4508/g.8777  ORF Transcript_4508/g.8777 Transcript_4508/m.8777 type:complete len:574 (+) Transcript_4508:54-1775(+)
MGHHNFHIVVIVLCIAICILSTHAYGAVQGRKRAMSIKVTVDLPASVPAGGFLGAIDQGTSSSRFMLFDQSNSGSIVASAQSEFEQIFPNDSGWHEHDPEAIWDSVVRCIEAARDALLEKGNVVLADAVRCIGITNQRETTVCWNASTGKCYGNAIVWDDTRTSDIAAEMASDHPEGQDRFRSATGLPLASYFSGTKIRWMTEHRPEIRAALEGDDRADVRFGTIDAWIVWKLTDGANFVTDASNASRTMLARLDAAAYDPELVAVFSHGLLEAAVHLPEIVPSVDAGAYGSVVSPRCLGGIPIAAVVGDQQAALFGQCAYGPGEAKCTYGTGMFLMMATGLDPVPSKHGLLTTVAYSRKEGGKLQTYYALEGSVAHCGSTIQWLRDRLEIIDDAAESSKYAAELDNNGDLYFVPAFSGLFAPYWRSDARACIVGMNAGHTKKHICRAALEAPGYQSRELFDAMYKDSGRNLASLRVDGGMTASEFAMQFQADILEGDIEVIRPVVTETTAAGAAYAAGLAVGVFDGLEDIRAMWGVDKTWKSKIDEKTRDKYWRGWKKAISKSMDWKTDAED